MGGRRGGWGVWKISWGSVDDRIFLVVEDFMTGLN